MYYTVGIMKRPSISVPFYKAPDAFTNWMKTTYIDSGKARITVSLSIDGLTKTSVCAWGNPADEAEFNSNENTVAMIADRLAYNNTNQIQRIWSKSDGTEPSSPP